MFQAIFILFLNQKRKKGQFICLLFIFLSIFVPLLFPLPKKQLAYIYTDY